MQLPIRIYAQNIEVILQETQLLKQIKLLWPGNVREEHVTHGKAIECNMQEKNGIRLTNTTRVQ